MKGIPDNSSVVIPRLICREPAAAIDFYIAVFAAAEVSRRPGPDGGVAHALLRISGAMIMVEAEWPTLPGRAPMADGTTPVVIFVDRSILGRPDRMDHGSRGPRLDGS